VICIEKGITGGGYIWEREYVGDEHHYCSKNVATPGATNFTLSIRGSYKLGGDNVVYTSKCDGSTLFHC